MAQMHSLESGFKKAKAASAERRRRRRLRRWFGWLAAGALALIVLGIGLNFNLVMSIFAPAPAVPSGDEVALDEAPDVYIPAIVDLAGDPMRISIGESFGGELTRSVPRPDGVPLDRASGEIAVLTDTMITQSQRFMTTLPSSPKDFAFYQSQRMRAATTVGDAETELAAYETETVTPDAFAEDAEPDFVLVDPDADPIEQPVAVTDAATLSDDGDGWGGTAATGEEQVTQTAVANTTSVTEVYEDSLRYRPDGDIFVRVLVDRTLQSLVTENGLSAADGELYAQAMAAAAPAGFGKDGLAVGDIVAIRAVRDGRDSPQRIVQLSLYTQSTYIGTLARADDSKIVVGADPWVREDLFKLSGSEEVAQPGRQYRLLDAVYSTATRNGVPTGVVGEAIMLMSRSFDLEAFASNDDKLVLAYARPEEGDAGGLGRVLYVAVKGTGRDLECYVYRASADSDFSCFDPSTLAAPSVTPGGMVTPVNGVMTSKFGPRMHPIFHEVRVHTGVDWAAPTGTPVYAAYAGTVASAAVAGGYGNMIRLSHPGGKETRYAHLSRFADGLVAGKQVAAGELIGYVGTTGNSTGPHLHFEVRVGDAPVDPLTTVVTVATVSTPVFVSDGSAVDRLTEKIVHVESGGSATAKNPLSSATGAGQFIKSTWLRMMRTYRPDLANSMSEADLLALRYDPDLSREMVRNLAREGEAYLKARGHEITAGRLYLCHFLGMEDAHRVLSASRELPVEAVLGSGVLGANPFLKGKDIAYLQDWAERKMSGAVPKTTTTTSTTQVAQTPAAPTASPEFALFKQAIADVLAPPNPDAEVPEEPTPETPPAGGDDDTAMLAPDPVRSGAGGTGSLA
jgi:murein DD-endopeptidase MepM/ murein hydrolase activator NlpD